jgi:hypothetical protein
LKPFYIFKISRTNKSLHAGWAAVGRKPGQAEGSLLATCMCATHTIATPAPASETHLKNAGVRHHHHGSCARSMKHGFLKLR